MRPAFLLLTLMTAFPAAMASTPHPYSEHELNLGKAPLALGATLTLPHGNGPFPAVVLVAGSGPNDRDETIGPNKPFRDIAQGLAEHGIAVLRYDKRSKAHPEAFIGKTYTIDDEVTDDALAAVALLRAQPQVDSSRIFVLGHSLGAELAPRIAQRDPGIAGLILIAAPAHPLLDEMLRQLRYISGVMPEAAVQIESQIALVEAQRAQLPKLDAAHPDSPGPLGLPASYWLSLRDYHAIAVAESLRQPMLILQGGGDYQVTPKDDFRQWQAAFAQDPRVTLREYPGLSHLMMPAGDPPSPADYTRPGHVDTRVIVDVAKWIESQPAR
jgi:dienelactone hydrolase